MIKHGIMLLIVAAFAPAQALLLGEKARNAQLGSLKSALSYYKKGASHDEVWRRTKWYCPLRTRAGCRFEVAGKCTDVRKVNMVAIQHTAFTGQIPLAKVFNASCIWQRYPSIKSRIFIYFGDCGTGFLGTASRRHDGSGRICLSNSLLKEVFAKGAIQGKEKINRAKRELHRVFIHEMQHHIQFVEQWPTYDRATCPYHRRMLEREAFYVADKRELMSKKQRKATPPHWFSSGLC